MGCNNSKAGKVGIFEVSPAKEKSKLSSPRKSSSKPKRLLKRAQLGEDRAQSDKSRDSVDSLGSQKSLKSESDRGFSASSKGSKHSQDSGIGDGDELYMITENSDPDKVQEIERNFKEPILDLGIVGVKCGSAGDQDRLDEQRILAALRQEGLISKTTSKAHGGVAFEVFEETPASMSHLPPIRPPPRLEKLEKKRKKQKKPLTEEEIQAKLEKAERRRKEREAARASRGQQKELQVRETADSAQQERQTQLQELTSNDMDAKLQKRQLKMLDRQRRLQAKAEHAEKVRQRKLAALAAGAPRQEDGEDAKVIPE